MSENVIISIIAGGFSLLAVIISAMASLRINKISELMNSRKLEQDIISRKSEFLDPIVRSSYDLQSRFYNIIANGFANFGNQSDRRKEYYIYSTVYIILQFFASVEVSRKLNRDVFVNEGANVDYILNILQEVSRLFSSDGVHGVLNIHSIEQRALGEYVLTEDGNIIGYNKFIQKMSSNDDKFVGYVVSDLLSLVNSTEGEDRFDRMKRIQHELLKIVAAFDPKKARFPAEQRRKA